MNKGFVVFYTTLLVLAITLALAGSIYMFTFSIQKIVKNMEFSAQAYYASESGLEDAVYRVKNFLSYPASYVLQVGPSSQTSVAITPIGSSRVIESEGQQENRVRKTQAILTVSSENVSFFYGVQVGNQGLSLGNGSQVVGNVFSNGDIEGGGKTQSTITGTAQVAGNHGIKDITVQGDAYADHLSNCAIGGTLFYVSSISSCTYSSKQVLGQQILPQGFPVTQEQINTWKAAAEAGGILSGYSLGNSASGSLGPKKINGNITLGNGATLTLTGTVWVTSTINFGNTDTIKLDPSYETASGVLILDGAANIGNGAVFKGSGKPGSDLIVISLYGPGTAFDLGNTAIADIFYAPNGIIEIGNGLNVKEVTANGLRVGNLATITYQFGLANMSFVNGPGGSFKVSSWKEIE